MSRTAADYMAETLESVGVKRIYGVVGDSLNGFTDSLRRLKAIEWIHVRHEEGAAFAAGAEAHVTGQLAVCAGRARLSGLVIWLGSTLAVPCSTVTLPIWMVSRTASAAARICGISEKSLAFLNAAQFASFDQRSPGPVS